MDIYLFIKSPLGVIGVISKNTNHEEEEKWSVFTVCDLFAILYCTEWTNLIKDKYFDNIFKWVATLLATQKGPTKLKPLKEKV